MLIYSLIGFLGLLLGELFRKKFKEEVDEKWFKLIRRIILLVILIVLLSGFDYLLIIGIIIGFSAYYLIKNIYLYLGFAVLGFNEVAGLLSGLVFMFGLFSKFKVKYLFYFLPLVLLFFEVGYGLFYGFTMGGILNYVINYKRLEE